ncbi:patatin-like phospholipase family protein [Clostridium sp. KNHs216]|uniref:patatin-like phospholipase family protein n=1 Tax=Clostridium sp. KNHs216 TaxID=1550235 RepID=UPI00114E6FDD|nr:patatin-like phospholipase family protein [Clostridium sp. KNHs216]TQI68737.1 NTE family protein [Clostridium sp. KNHs216]
MSFGLALSGGGTKGAAHVGVLLALEEAGMRPSSIAGTSAGAIVAGLYATGTNAPALKQMVMDLSKTGMSLCDADFVNLLKAVPQLLFRHKIDITGLFKGNRLEKFLCAQTDNKNIMDANIKTIIPAVDINSGETIVYTSSLRNVDAVEGVTWKTDIPICQAIRASMAVPAVFRPKQIGDLCLVDGGVTNTLPVDLLTAAGESNVLAVDVTKEYEVPARMNIIDITTHSLSIMSTRLKELSSHGEKLLLKPQLPRESGLLTFEQMEQCMDAGYEAAQMSMAAIKAIFK